MKFWLLRKHFSLSFPGRKSWKSCLFWWSGKNVFLMSVRFSEQLLALNEIFEYSIIGSSIKRVVFVPVSLFLGMFFSAKKFWKTNFLFFVNSTPYTLRKFQKLCYFQTNLTEDFSLLSFMGWLQSRNTEVPFGFWATEGWKVSCELLSAVLRVFWNIRYYISNHKARMNPRPPLTYQRNTFVSPDFFSGSEQKFFC